MSQSSMGKKCQWLTRQSAMGPAEPTWIAWARLCLDFNDKIQSCHGPISKVVIKT